MDTMIQISLANNTNYNTSGYSLELKAYMEQIASSQNLREQIVGQIFIITNIQKAINDNSILNNLDIFLTQYNNSIAKINGDIITTVDKISYFDIDDEKSKYSKQSFTSRLAIKCQEVETVFNKVVTLNAQAIQNAKEYISAHQEPQTLEPVNSIGINNSILLNS